MCGAGVVVVVAARRRFVLEGPDGCELDPGSSDDSDNEAAPAADPLLFGKLPVLVRA